MRSVREDPRPRHERLRAAIAADFEGLGKAELDRPLAQAWLRAS
jgi:hypothetical protein